MVAFSSNPSVFDTVAENYDEEFTHTLLGRLLRERVWDVVNVYFKSGHHILELNCGTGEDALWMSRKGISVTATDPSEKMLDVLRSKIRVNSDTLVHARNLSFQGLHTAEFPNLFDGIFSNFGGINLYHDWKSLAQSMAKIIKPGGIVIIVPMGPLCPFEILSYLLKGQPSRAFRRFKKSAEAKIGENKVPIWYPTPGKLKKIFYPNFRHITTLSLGLLLPTSDFQAQMNQWPAFLSQMNRMEKIMARWTLGYGDHYIIVFQKH